MSSFSIEVIDRGVHDSLNTLASQTSNMKPILQQIGEGIMECIPALAQQRRAVERDRVLLRWAGNAWERRMERLTGEWSGNHLRVHRSKLRSSDCDHLFGEAERCCRPMFDRRCAFADCNPNTNTNDCQPDTDTNTDTNTNPDDGQPDSDTHRYDRRRSHDFGSGHD